jgi:hypothetical protein
MMSRRGGGTALLLALSVTASELFAQSPASERAPTAGGRTLGGHTYVPLLTVPTPFVGTSVAVGAGGAVALEILEAVTVDIGGQEDTLLSEGNLAFASVQFGFQQHVASRFAIRGTANVSVRTGTSGRMILAEGISGLSGYTIGALAMLHRSERRMLTGTLDWRRNSLTEFTPSEFAEYAGEWGLDSVEQWGEHLFQERKNGRLVAGVRGAWTVRPWLGVFGLVEGGAANLYESGSSFATTLGAGGSIDLLQTKATFPVGISLGVGWTNTPNRSDDIFGTTATFALGLYYSGRQEMAVGLDLESSTTKLLETDDRIHVMGLRFGLRYDF